MGSETLHAPNPVRSYFHWNRDGFCQQLHTIRPATLRARYPHAGRAKCFFSSGVARPALSITYDNMEVNLLDRDTYINFATFGPPPPTHTHTRTSPGYAPVFSGIILKYMCYISMKNGTFHLETCVFFSSCHLQWKVSISCRVSGKEDFSAAAMFKNHQLFEQLGSTGSGLDFNLGCQILARFYKLQVFFLVKV